MAAVIESKHPEQVPAGGSFLFSEVGSLWMIAPENFTEEQRLYLKTARQFVREQVLPKAEQLEKKDYALFRELIAKAGELGLLMIEVPERHGGLNLDKTTSMLVSEAKSAYGSWSVTFGAQTGIGTLPIVWFGNEAQKAKYLPKLSSGEFVSAYALTEPGSGSDALGAKTKAVLSPDGKHYILNGSKQFITNAAFADVFIVFAKVDGEKFTGFIVDKDTPGFVVGKEEHKMGLRGSSTCMLFFEDAKVPVENVLGEIGKGHKIAFNVLNHGRLKLGVGVLGGMKHSLRTTLEHAVQRKQFQTAIIDFPLIREKFAKMAVLAYAVESMAYRTSGLIDARLQKADKSAMDFEQKALLPAIEEYAIESSILKVFGSEALTTVVDESVQVHGGSGYIEEYPIERAYRDQRVNRIFEGTNEINRMLITGRLLKRAMKGQLPLFEVVQSVDEELTSKNLPKDKKDDELSRAALAAEYLKRMALYALKVAAEAFGPELEHHQQLLADVADIAMDAFALDSMVTRTRQCASSGKLDPVRVAMIQHFLADAHSRSFEKCKKALCAAAKADVEQHLAKIQPLYFFTPYDPEGVRETIVKAIVEKGEYPVEQA